MSARRLRFDPHVRLYLLRFSDARQSPASRLRMRVVGPLPDSISVLLANFGGAEPGSAVALAAVKRLTNILDGTRHVVLYHRNTTTALTEWLGREIRAASTVESVEHRWIDARRKRRSGRRR